MLGCLLAGSNALSMASVDEGALVRHVLDALPPTLRRSAVERFMEARVHRWCRGVSRSGGLPLATRDAPPGLERLPGLPTVGAYLFDSTLNGVYQSADVATSLLSAHMLAGTAVRARERRVEPGRLARPGRRYRAWRSLAVLAASCRRRARPGSRGRSWPDTRTLGGSVRGSVPESCSKITSAAR